MTDASIYKRVARADDIGPHYSIYRVVPGNGEAALREMFPDAEANDMNFVLFSTSGVHGSYSTIEDCEAAATNPDESPSLTFVIVQPRLVCMRYGTLDVSPENVDFFEEASRVVVVRHGHDWGATKDVAGMIEIAGGKVESMTVFSDGHGVATASFPLPKDHWLYADDGGFDAPPMPMRMGTDDPRRQAFNDMVRSAARYAVRAATMKGKEQDFDPDALVQNMVVGLLGYHTPDGLCGMDDWANPKPVPPAFGNSA